MNSNLKNILMNIYKLLFLILGKLLPKNKDTIVFESFLGKQYSDNPRAIYEYLKTKRPHMNFYWSIDHNAEELFKGKNVNYIKRFSFKWLIVMNTSKYWISNSRMPLWIPKPNKTIYIQTWHGTPLKKLANDMSEVLMPGTDTDSYKKNFLHESSKWDYLISPNPYSTEIFKRAFKFDNEIIESGYPRNDYLVNKNTCEEKEFLRNKYKLPHGKKIILYAPTWRDNQYYDVGKYKFSLLLDLNNMMNALKDDYIIVLRMHYLIAENLNLNGLEEFAFDLSTAEDIRELYLLSDMLITDYSSVFFDYLILEKPILFFTPDLEAYRDKIRGFYFNIEDAPGPIIKTTEGIINNIQTIDSFNYQDINYFKDKFCGLEDGNSTQRAVDSIFNN